MPPWDQLHQDIIACTRCPRLVAWRQQIAATKRRAYQNDDYWAKPLPGFGDPNAQILILGLAPAAHGGNRTGRMFTGDSSADFLISALHRAGFASQPTSRHRADGLELNNTFITAALRCAPPDNRPTPTELAHCRPFLSRELILLPRVRVVLALGKIAFDSYLHLLRPSPLWPHLRGLHFAHGAQRLLPPPHPALIASYHPSRQNTQTGRLTPAMLDHILAQAHSLIASPNAN